MAATSPFKELLIENLQDLYDAENQLVKALPQMAKAASSDELRQGFEEHLDQTKEHVQRLQSVFENLGEKASGKKCKAMEGLIKEGSEVIEDDLEPEVKDAALIAAAQKVEHYEISGYGSVRTWAELLGEDDSAELLQQTLDEEKETDEKLSGFAEQINVEAKESEGQQDQAEGGSKKAGRTSVRRSKPAA
jgi:ferritin-like metal-binding protein YciE